VSRWASSNTSSESQRGWALGDVIHRLVVKQEKGGVEAGDHEVLIVPGIGDDRRLVAGAG
jgi:hypothetical protein